MARNSGGTQERNTDHRPARPAEGWVLRFTGRLLLFVGVGAEISGPALTALLVNLKSPVWGAIVGSSLLLVGYRIFNHGRQLSLRGRRILNPVLSEDWLPEPGSFTLYLRSFDDDAQRLTLERAGNDAMHNLPFSGLTQEEQLVSALQPVGPVVALGRPGEPLPQAGAKRMYLPQEDWQAKVRELMHRARFVVIAAGHGHSLRWEFLESVQIVPPNRLALVVFGHSPDSYDRFCESIAEDFVRIVRKISPDQRLSPRLPDYPSEPGWRDGIWLAFFARDWTPRSSIVHRSQPNLSISRKGWWSHFSRVLMPKMQELANSDPSLNDQISRAVRRYDIHRLVMKWSLGGYTGGLIFGLLFGVVLVVRSGIPDTDPRLGAILVIAAVVGGTVCAAVSTVVGVGLIAVRNRRLLQADRPRN